jgi:hypothetical protein
VIVLDSLLLGGLRFVLGKIAAAVDAELSDDSVWREELLAAQMRLELGEIGEDEFRELERELLGRISEIRERRRPGTADRFTVTAVEALLDGDGSGGDEGRPAVPSRSA